MPKKKLKKKYDFTPVAMFFIVVGVIFFVLGLLMILFLLPVGRVVPLPDAFLITIGGALLMAGGYINLELALIRRQLKK